MKLGMIKKNHSLFFVYIKNYIYICIKNKIYMNYIYTLRPDLSKIVGGVEITEDITLSPKKISKFTIHNPENDIIVTDGILNKEEVDKIVSIYEASNSYAPVSVQGMAPMGNMDIGSMRITGYYPKLAMELDKILSVLFMDLGVSTKICDDYTPTDFWQDDLGYEWEYYGISPMLRFMKYESHGKHHPHYDAGFIYPNSEIRTLKSFVLYLTTNDTGATRIVGDGKQFIKTKERNHDDWNRMAENYEVISFERPELGKIMIFDHRICHDVEEFLPSDVNEKRIIIRGDIVYKLKK